jgi:hypothetical protein
VAFRTRWVAHDVRLHVTCAEHLRHPVVGELDIVFDTMPLPADPGLTSAVYTAEPGSESAEELGLLASWSVPTVSARPAPAVDET